MVYTGHLHHINWENEQNLSAVISTHKLLFFSCIYALLFPVWLAVILNNSESAKRRLKYEITNDIWKKLSMQIKANEEWALFSIKSLCRCYSECSKHSIGGRAVLIALFIYPESWVLGGEEEAAPQSEWSARPVLQFAVSFLASLHCQS